MTTYTITAAFYDQWNKADLIIDAETPEAAMVEAIRRVNEGESPTDLRTFDAGPTFIAAICEGRHGDGWSGGQVPIPFTLLAPEDFEDAIVTHSASPLRGLVASLVTCAGLLEGALSAHIYNEDAGESAPPDDPNVLAVAEARRAFEAACSLWPALRDVEPDQSARPAALADPQNPAVVALKEFADAYCPPDGSPLRWEDCNAAYQNALDVLETYGIAAPTPA